MGISLVATLRFLILICLDEGVRLILSFTLYHVIGSVTFWQGVREGNCFVLFIQAQPEVSI